MSLRVMLVSLRRHGLMPSLVFLQVAVACAILCNVSFLAWQRLEPMLAPSGVDADNLILIDNLAPVHGVWSAAESQAAEEAFRGVPGVRAASAAFGLPMVSMMSMEFHLQGPTKSTADVNAFMGKGLIDTLGLQLIAGRDFLPEEYRPFGVGAKNDNAKWDDGVPEPVIITQALARKLFGASQPLGGMLGDPTDPGSYRVVGVVRHLLRNELSLATDGQADDTVLIPRSIGNTAILSYAIRVEPAMHDAAMRGVKQVVKSQFGPRTENGPQARVEWHNDKREEALASSRAALWLLLGLVLAVIVVTVVGIMGLTGFWVQRRTRQIGIHRALGARRVDILRYFLAENALIVCAGVVVGMVLAYGGNTMLMHYYELPHLPWIYLPVGGLAMLLMGQLSVFVPALRAAAVPPVVATRSV